MSLPIPTLPTTTGAFQIGDGVRTVTLPSTISSDGEARSATNYNNRPDGLSGTVRSRSVSFDPINLSITGPILDSTIIQDLSRIIGSGRVTVTRDGKTLDGDVVSWSLRERITDEIWDFSLEVESNWHYWKGSTVTSGSDPATVSNDGDFKVYPIFTLVGTGSGATVVNITIDGLTAEYTGSIAVGETLIINCEDTTVTLDGANVLNAMNASFFTTPPVLNQGSNAVTKTVTGTATLTVQHTERFLS